MFEKIDLNQPCEQFLKIPLYDRYTQGLFHLGYNNYHMLWHPLGLSFKGK